MDAKELTLEEVGNAVDRTKSAVSLWLSGSRQIPPKIARRLAEWIAQRYGIDPERFAKESLSVEEVNKSTGGSTESTVLREEGMGWDMKDGDGEAEAVKREREALTWLLKNEDEIIEKVTEVLHDKRTSLGKRILRAHLLLEELKRRNSSSK